MYVVLTRNHRDDISIGTRRTNMFSVGIKKCIPCKPREFVNNILRVHYIHDKVQSMLSLQNGRFQQMYIRSIGVSLYQDVLHGVSVKIVNSHLKWLNKSNKDITKQTVRRSVGESRYLLGFCFHSFDLTVESLNHSRTSQPQVRVKHYSLVSQLRVKITRGACMHI